MLGKYIRFSVVVGVVLTAAPAVADEPASGGSAQANARAIAQRGLEHFDARRWPEAYDRLHQADAVFHAPTLTLYMARSLRELGKLVEARSLYEQILSDPMAKGTYADARESARAELGLLVPRIASVEVVVTGVSYEAAGVRLDGASLPEARQQVNPGAHRIETGAHAGHLMKSLTLAEGENRRIEIIAPKPAELTPIRGPRTQAKSSPLMPALVIGGGAASAVALGVGIGLTAWSSSAAADRETFRAACLGGDQGGCSQFDSSDQRRWLTGNAAVYSFIGAGALAIATTTYALVVPRINRPPRVTSSSRPGATTTGLSFSW